MTDRPDDRTFRRRRLASLTAVLALVLAVGSLVGGGSDDVIGVTTDAAAGAEVVRAASLGSPTGVRELLAETGTSVVEAAAATTTTTADAPATTAPVTSAPPDEADEHDEVADGDDAAEPTSTTAPAPASRAETTATETDAPTTTQAPRREASTTTAAPTTTTAAPPATASSTSSDGYAYDDPRSTQVWYDLAECESGGNWSIDSGNGYYGGLQFSLGTWESVGGSGYPHEHPAATQIERGRELQARQGWGAWPHCSEELGLR